MPSGPPASAARVGLVESLPETASGAELASLFNITPRFVRDLAERGILVRADDKGGKGFAVLASLRAYMDHLRRMAAGRTSEGLSLADERAKTEQLKQQELIDRKADRDRKNIPREVVREGWTRFATIVRTSFLSLPSKIRAAVPHLTAHDTVTIGAIVRERLEDAAAEIEGGAVPGAVLPSELSES